MIFKWYYHLFSFLESCGNSIKPQDTILPCPINTFLLEVVRADPWTFGWSPFTLIQVLEPKLFSVLIRGKSWINLLYDSTHLDFNKNLRMKRPSVQLFDWALFVINITVTSVSPLPPNLSSFLTPWGATLRVIVVHSILFK